MYKVDIIFGEIRLKRNSRPPNHSGIGSSMSEATENSMRTAPPGQFSLFTVDEDEIQIRLLDAGENTNDLWSQYKG